MKYLLFLSFCLNINAQKLLNIIPKMEREDTTHGKLHFLNLDKNGISVIGEITPIEHLPNIKSKIVFIRYDYSGNLMFQKELNFAGISNPRVYPSKKLDLNDSISILTFNNDSIISSFPQTFICKINIITGEILQISSGNYYDRSVDSSQFLGGLISKSGMITFTEISSINKFGYMRISKFDTLLNLLFVKTYNLGSIFEYIPAFIFEKNPNGFIVFGDAYNVRSSRTSIFKAELDSNYNLIKIDLIKTSLRGSVGFFLLSRTSSIIQMGENEWYILADEVNKIDGEEVIEPHLYSYNSDLNKFNWDIKVADDSLVKICIVETNQMLFDLDKSGITICGHTFFQEIGKAFMFLTKVSLDGKILWNRIINPVAEQKKLIWSIYLTSMQENLFHNINIIGYFGDYTTRRLNPWLLQLDEYGCYVPNCEDLENTSKKILADKKDIRIYSFLDKLLIQNDNFVFGQIFDINGRIIKYLRNLQGKETIELSISDLLYGIYYVKLLDSGGNVYTKKIEIF